MTQHYHKMKIIFSRSLLYDMKLAHNSRLKHILCNFDENVTIIFSRKWNIGISFSNFGWFCEQEQKGLLYFICSSIGGHLSCICGNRSVVYILSPSQMWKILGWNVLVIIPMGYFPSLECFTVSLRCTLPLILCNLINSVRRCISRQAQ